MGQYVFLYDLNHRIIFWNQGAERVYRYTAAEVIGTTLTELLAEPKDASFYDIILERTVNGESWCGQFPIKNKNEESFVVICSNTPFRDENGMLVGAMCVSRDSRKDQADFNSEQPVHTSIASKISNLALKVKLKLKTGGDGDHWDNVFTSSTRGHLAPYPFGVFFSRDTEEHFSGNQMSIENKCSYLSLEDIMVSPRKEIVCFDRSTAPARLDCQSNKMKASGSIGSLSILIQFMVISVEY